MSYTEGSPCSANLVLLLLAYNLYPMQKQSPKATDVLAAAKIVGVDADTCFEQMEAGDSQFARRNWIRALFSWIEAVCYFLRRFTIEKRFAKRVIRPVDIPEFSALSEVRYTVTAKGEAIAEPANSRTIDYIWFSLVACLRIQKLSFDVDRGGKSWQDLVQAIRIRDRITHPKSIADVTISDQDIELVKRFKSWFHGHLNVISDKKIQALVRKEAGIAKRTKKPRDIVVHVT